MILGLVGLALPSTALAARGSCALRPRHRYGVVAREEAYLERKLATSIAANARACGAAIDAPAMLRCFTPQPTPFFASTRRHRAANDALYDHVADRAGICTRTVERGVRRWPKREPQRHVV